MQAELGYDVLVVGAGPAGLAAASAAAEHGARVGVIDDNATAGGQIWRQERGRLRSPALQAWLTRAEVAGVELHPGAAVTQIGDGEVWCNDPGGATTRLEYARLVLATGARELFLPFPGWTLPGVTGAGGLQALAKGGWPVSGRRVVVAGSGPLLLAVAAHLRGAGAEIAMIAEQAPAPALAAFAARLPRSPSKLVQALRLQLRLLPRRVRTSTWPLRAEGDDRLEAVVLRRGDAERRVACDLLACGFGLVPDTVVAAHLGCALDGDRVSVDAAQQTSVEGIYAAGELTGIGGVDLAVAEGLVAGLAAAAVTVPPGILRRREREQRFAAALERAFRLRPELAHLPRPDTIVCRCEDVTWAQLQACAEARDAKLKARCGMGPCQGRVCGPALRFLRGWGHDSVRPPLFPVPASALVEMGRERRT